MGEEVPGAAITALNLVENQECPGLGACLAEPAHKVVGHHAYAGHTLDALYDDGGKLAGGQLAAHGFDVAEGCEIDVGSGIERRPDSRIVGCRHGARRAAVEGAVEGEYFGAAGGERCQLDGVFVCLGAGVAQEQRV